MFPCEYFRIFKNTYFDENLRTTASATPASYCRYFFLGAFFCFSSIDLLQSSSSRFRVISGRLLYYSVIPIKRTFYKADISLRRTVYLGRDWFTVKLLWKNLLIADNYKAQSCKTDTFFVPQINFLTTNNFFKAYIGTKTIFT